MRIHSLVATLGFIAISSTAFAQAPAAGPNVFPVAGSAIKITPIKHASFQIDFANHVVQVDPISTNDNSHAVASDIVLITDIHGDHMDAKAIEALRKPAGVVVAPAAVRDALKGKSENITVIANGETKSFFGISIEAVPMYNLTRGPAAGQLFHTKGRGNGYILTLGGKRLYIAGDTECTTEMKALKNIDIAFIPMNLPYTMTPAEAADCVKAFAPKVVYAYHYNTPENAAQFAEALKGTAGVDVRSADWYPAAPARGAQ